MPDFVRYGEAGDKNIMQIIIARRYGAASSSLPKFSYKLTSNVKDCGTGAFVYEWPSETALVRARIKLSKLKKAVF